MSADKSTEWLIDLLYQEEPDSDPGGPPESLSEDDLALSQAYRSFLSEVREQLPEAAPAQHTLDTILEAARAQAAASTATSARTTRAPQAPRDLSSSIWRKARVQTLSQIAGVALVLVVGAFALGKLPQDDRASEPAPMAAAIAAAPQGDFPELEAPPASPGATPGEGVALGKAAPEQDGYFDKARDALMRSRAQSAPSSFDASAQAPPPAEPPAPAEQMGERAEAREGSSAPSELAAVPAQHIMSGAYKDALQPRSPKGGLDGLEVTSGAERAASLGRTTPQGLMHGDVVKGNMVERDDQARPDADGELEQKAQLAEPAPLASPEARPLAVPKPTTASRSSASSGPSAEPEPAPEASVAPSAPAKKEIAAKPAPMPSQPAPAISLQRAEGALKSQDYRTALSQADGFLSADLGKPNERARALEIKARAYEGMGQTAQAARALEALEREHPAYYKARNLQQVQRKARQPDSSMEILPSSKP